MTEFFNSHAGEAAKKQLAEVHKNADRMRTEFGERMKGRPTPTQEENDLAALGAHIKLHDDDGSGPDLYATRHLEAGPPGTYQTRQVAPAMTAQHRPPPPQRAVPRASE